MPRQSKQTMQLAAAIARESKKNLPKDHFKKLAQKRKKQMGPISRLETYPKETLMKLAGWGNAAWGRAVRSGLEIARPGNQVHVTGEAYFRWIESQSKAETN